MNVFDVLQMSARAIRQQERAQRRLQQRNAANVHRIGIGANTSNSNNNNGNNAYGDDVSGSEDDEEEESEEQERLHRVSMICPVIVIITHTGLLLPTPYIQQCCTQLTTGCVSGFHFRVLTSFT